MTGTPVATDPAPRPDPPVVAAPAHRPPARHPGLGVAAVVGVLMVLTASALLTGGLVLRVVDEVARDSHGYFMSSTLEVESAGSAVLTEDVVIDKHSTVVDLPDRVVGRVKVVATGLRGEVFVGIADSDEVRGYLDGVARSTLLDPAADEDLRYDVDEGGLPSSAPGDLDIWLVSAQGSGEQTVSITPEAGDWTIVVMNPDGSSPVAAEVQVGATLPLLDEVAYALLAGGLLLLAGGVVVLWTCLHRWMT